MTIKRHLVEGQRVRIRRADTEDDWCLGKVAIASRNGKSIALALYGVVRNKGSISLGSICGGVLPLSIDYDAETVAGLEGILYEMEVCDERETNGSAS